MQLFEIPKNNVMSETQLYYHLEDAVNDNVVVNTINGYDINKDNVFKLPAYITKHVADLIEEYPDGAGQSISGRLYDLFFMALYQYQSIKNNYVFLPHFFFKCIFLVPGEKKPYHKTYTFFLQFRDEYDLGGDVMLIGMQEEFDEDYFALKKI